MITWQALEREISDQLGDQDDAKRIIEASSGYSRAELISNGSEVVPPAAQLNIEEMVKRRNNGEPLQYVIGAWSFRQLELIVDQRVLIPRPETEIVVEVALRELSKFNDELNVVDLGTGSGAIALSLAFENRHVRVWATDISPDALVVARANLAGIGQAGARVMLAQGKWFEALPVELKGNVDMIVSNPPYIAESETLPPEVAEWELTSALIAGPSGLESYAEIFSQSSQWLSDRGIVVVEIAPHQAALINRLADQYRFDLSVEIDLAGRERGAVAKKF